MATKLHGYINLSKIPKGLITTNRAGDKVLWVDILERRQPSQYGATHMLTAYDSENRETFYLADLAPQTFGGDGAQGGNAPAPRQAEAEDLPF